MGGRRERNHAHDTIGYSWEKNRTQPTGWWLIATGEVFCVEEWLFIDPMCEMGNGLISRVRYTGIAI